jgi:hypothetical protein
VLHAKRDDFEVEIIRCVGVSAFCAFAFKAVSVLYTRLAADPSTPTAARELAARAWPTVRDFDVSAG